VAGWCRTRRLARCRTELADPRSRGTITDIAFSWGFSDAARFSRAFNETFGVSPIAFRRAHKQGDSHTSLAQRLKQPRQIQRLDANKPGPRTIDIRDQRER
jgi:AraC-like DNA-binding protein